MNLCESKKEKRMYNQKTVGIQMGKPNSLLKFVIDSKNRNLVSFHMPGHKGGDLYKRFGYGEVLSHITDFDITEFNGADNLFQAAGILKNTMEDYSKLYGSKKSYLLVNGSSCGVISAIMSAVSQGDTLIMARNSHKSVYNALSLIGAKPVYAHPEILKEYGISGAVPPEEVQRCVKEHPNAKAVILTSPNYYGICSDLSSIAEIVHRAGMILIVDQAHGAHLKFFDEILKGNDIVQNLNGKVCYEAAVENRVQIDDTIGKMGIASPLSAENNGADIIINSTHKTLASFTQSAIINVMSDRVSIDDLEDALQKMESTSPSYLLMLSLDINSQIMSEHRSDLIRSWKEELDRFYNLAAEIKGLKTVVHPMLDYTKINLDMSEIGLDGLELQKELEKRDIIPELSAGSLVMCMSGIGNVRRDYDRLLEELKDISEKFDKNESTIDSDVDLMWVYSDVDFEQREIPKKKVKMQINDTIGMVCAQSLIPYPPGIPAICPGEVINEDLVIYIKELNRRGRMVMGLYDNETIFVGK